MKLFINNGQTRAQQTGTNEVEGQMGKRKTIFFFGEKNEENEEREEE